MRMENSKNGMLDYFSLLVIGENPDDVVYKYDLMSDVDKPYILYKYSDITLLRNKKINIYKGLLNKIINPIERNAIDNKIKDLESMSDEDYYKSLSELNSFDSNGNIISIENPYGKWLTCEKGGKIFSRYLKDFNDNGVISTNKNQIDWSLTHMRSDKVNTYNRTWDLCVNFIKSESEKDDTIFKNMSKYKNYFESFKDKEEYVKMGCSFWTYAIIINGTWVDMEDKSEYVWICNFYDTFIKNLSDDTLITIYECTK